MISGLARLFVVMAKLFFWLLILAVLIALAPWLFAVGVVAVAIAGVLALAASICVVVAWRRY